MQRRRKIPVKFDRRMPHTFTSVGKVYVVDERGRTFMEMSGVADFKHEMGTKESRKNHDTVYKGSYRQGSNTSFVFYDRVNQRVIFTMKGGVHPVSFVFDGTDEMNKFLLMLANGFGKKVYKHKKGGWLIYVGKR